MSLFSIGIIFVIGTVSFALFSFCGVYFTGKWKALPGLVRKRINETDKLSIYSFLASLFVSFIINMLSFSVIIHLRPTVFQAIFYAIALLPVMIYATTVHWTSAGSWKRKYGFLTDLVSSVSLSLSSVVYFIVLRFIFLLFGM